MTSRADLTRDAAVGMAAGTAGTAVMSLSLRLQRRLRGYPQDPIDYDSSDAPVRAVDRLLRLPPGTGVDSALLRQSLYWGYGTGAGSLRGALAAAGVRDPWAAVAFFTATWGAALVLFPATGATPPVRKWRRDVFWTSCVQHAVYAAATSLAYEGLSRRLPAAA